MAVQISNSLSDFLEQSVILEKNGLNTISGFQEAMHSDKDYVTLTLTDPTDNNKETTYRIPSFGYLQKSINRIDRTLNTLMNVNGDTNSRVRLSDNSYRKLITASIPSEAPTITKIDGVTNFKFKTNWFFEDMLNPCLYITLDLTDKIDVSTERVLVRRFLLNCTNEEQKKAFNDKKLLSGNLSYAEFINFVVSNNIKYNLDEEIRDLPARAKRYHGKFIITNSFPPTADYDRTITKVYTLRNDPNTLSNNLVYTDTLADPDKRTRVLSVGDCLEVDEHPTTTKFKVVHIEDNNVTLELIEGARGVNVGTKLKISSSQETNVNVEIPVGYDEREVIFIKPIDPNSNIPADEWSPGIVFFSNELKFIDRKGEEYTLQKFYQKFVVDFGQVILSYAKDYYPSIREAIKPDAPKLKDDNFRVVNINSHLIDSDVVKELEKYNTEKRNLAAEIEGYSKQISEIQKEIEEEKYESPDEKIKLQLEMSELLEKQQNKMTEYISIVNLINVKSYESYTITPKYRVRGFWDIPNPQVSTSSDSQQVIKFRIQYMYLPKNPESDYNKPLKIPFVSEHGNSVEAVYSNWNEVMSVTRNRVLKNNEYVWEEIDMTSDDIKPNQCDIPINPGEKVRIRVKALSEAGYPANCAESDWSNVIELSFVDVNNVIDTISTTNDIIEQNKVDSAIINYNNMLQC